MDMNDANASGFFDDTTKAPSATKVTRTTGLLEGMKDGHHSARYKTRVPEDVDPYLAADRVATRFAQHPAPSFPWPFQTPLVTPSEYPQETRTMGQKAHVSKASSEDNHEHSVMVEADPKHLLGGIGGASGINYLTYVKEGKHGPSVVTEKESYGQSMTGTNALRALVGNLVLDPHMSNQQDRAIADLMRELKKTNTNL